MLTRILPTTVVAAALACAATTLAYAQQAPGGPMPPGPAEPGQAFRAYTLRSARAADAYGQLAQLLSALPVKTDVVVDERGNRLLVNGTPEAHQIVQRLVDSIDRPEPAAPTASAPNPAALGPAVVESYGAPADLLPVVMGELRARFPAHLNVRMAADVPRNQLLVVAPKEVHRQIGEYLRTRAAQAGPSADEVTRPNASLMYLGRVEGQAVPIESAWETLHAKLKQVWGDRLTPVPAVSADPRAAALSTYTVQLTGGGALRLEYDPAAKKVTILGNNEAAANCARLVTALDRPPREPGVTSQVVPLGNAKRELVERAVAAIVGRGQGEAGTVRALRPWDAGDAAAGTDRRRTNLVGMLFQKQPAGEDLPPKQPPGSKAPALGGALTGQVQLYFIPELDMIIITGREADVKKIEDLIKEIARNVPTPEVVVHQLQHVDSEALSNIVTQLYATVYTARSGSVQITPLVKPNALLLIGQKTAVDAALELIKRLDTPASPDAEFEIFRLRHMSARVAQTTLQQLYGASPGPRPTREEVGVAQTQPQLPGLFPRIYVYADYRTNSLIVRGAARDLAEVARMLSELDRPDAAAELTLRIFPLHNSLAAELATILQNAIAPPVTGGAGGQGQQQQQQQQQFQIPGLQQAQGQQGQGQARAQSSNQGLESRSTALRLMTLDAKNRQILTSGILTDVQVTADARANALLVKAPENSMELIAKLIEQLDQIPGAEVGVKIFTVLNGDAQSLVQMLVALFGQQTGPGGQQQQLQLGQAGPGGGPGPLGQAVQAAITASAQGESLVVPLRFAVDTRTNSILATGSVNDLQLVELILEKLSLSDVKDRKTNVYRLRNVPADLVSQAINQYLTNVRQVVQLGLPSAFEQIQQEVVIVPEVVTNSLIISATPRFYDEIDKIIKDLDRRPPMVMIQVLIAEVALNNADEFGVELGLQDSVLFDRSLISNLVTTTSVTQNQTGSQLQQTNIISSTATPGFAFNNQALGNNPIGATNRLGTQALSNFSVGRTNSALGYGGLVLSASSESVSVLVRALQECRRLEVLSRPQITTLNNQPAFIQVGQRVRFIETTTLNAQTNAQTNTLGASENVGLILGVTPRVADDGRVAMEIDVEKSEVGPEAEGIPISVLATGDVIRSPRIDTTTAQTTVSALSGQTIVLGGLITTNKATTHRRVPLLASIPVLGHLFRYDLETQRKTELLIILTPRVIWEEEDAELIKQMESARISWVLSDVQKMHGVEGLRTRWDSLDCKDIPVIYPDTDPRGMVIEHDGQIEEVLQPGAPGATPIPAPGTIQPKPVVPGTPYVPGGPGPVLPPRSLMPRPPATTPPGAAHYGQPPAAPTRLPRMPDDGPVISPPQTSTDPAPLSTAVQPGAAPYPTTSPQAAVRTPGPGYGLQAPPRPGPVQPAAYQAVYPAGPPPAIPPPWPPRGNVPPPAPATGPWPPAPAAPNPWAPPARPLNPVPQNPSPAFNPALPAFNPAIPPREPQAAQAENRPWGSS